MEMKCDRVF